MKLKEYLASKSITICCWIGGMLFGSLILMIAGVQPNIMILCVVFCILSVFIWLLLCFFYSKYKLTHLEKMISELSQKYLIGEILPHPTNLVERQYYDIMKTISRDAIETLETERQQQEEYRQYIEQWIHEMKTPLTASTLILANDGDVRKLKRELKRADNLTETILFYARMRSIQKDTVIRESNLREIEEKAIQNQRELLIAAGISVDITGDMFKNTDDKAVGFMMEQFLINTAKYCPGSHVTINNDNGVITYEDNGIGIPSNETGRIFERGFTGTNGRTKGGSTGMGLYIVHQLCEQLQIEITAESEVGKYTCFTLTI